MIDNDQMKSLKNLILGDNALREFYQNEKYCYEELYRIKEMFVNSNFGADQWHAAQKVCWIIMINNIENKNLLKSAEMILDEMNMRVSIMMGCITDDHE